jgi:hypothetical protein
MAKTTTNQWKPPSTAETSVNDGLSVRTARDLMWGANNYKFHAGNHKFISDMWVPAIGTLDHANEGLILYLGKWWIRGFSEVRWWLTAQLTAGTDRVDYKLYSASNLYIGREGDASNAFDSNLLWDPTSDTVQVTSGVWSRSNSTLSLGRPDFGGYRYFYLTATNDAGSTDATTRAEHVFLDVQPVKT